MPDNQNPTRADQPERAEETRGIQAYSEDYTPLGGYAALVAVYGLTFGTLLVKASAAGRLPKRLDPGDVLLTGIATHKISRIITKDWITSPLRAPFTEYQESLGSGEVSEQARGRGLQKAIGDLITCPWCIGPWVASGLAAGMVHSPRATRLVAGTFAAVTLSDFLHHAYQLAREAAKR